MSNMKLQEEEEKKKKGFPKHIKIEMLTWKKYKKLTPGVQ